MQFGDTLLTCRSTLQPALAGTGINWLFSFLIPARQGSALLCLHVIAGQNGDGIWRYSPALCINLQSHILLLHYTENIHEKMHFSVPRWNLTILITWACEQHHWLHGWQKPAPSPWALVQEIKMNSVTAHREWKENDTAWSHLICLWNIKKKKKSAKSLKSPARNVRKILRGKDCQERQYFC